MAILAQGLATWCQLLLSICHNPFLVAVAMEAFLQSVDPEPPAGDILTKVKELFEQGGITTVGGLVGLEENEVASGLEQLAAKAFARRAVRLANLADKAKQQQQVAIPSVAQEQAVDVAKLADLFGSDVSAGAVATALSAKPQDVDVPKLVAESACERLPSQMQVDVAILTALSADSAAARAARRGPSPTWI